MSDMPIVKGTTKEAGMTDQPQAEIQAEETQQAPMPSAEQNPEEVTQAVPQREEVSEPEVGELPEGAKERTTEQFEKLKEQLAQERTRRLEYEQYFQTQRPQPVAQPVVDADGTIDPNAVMALQQRQQALEQRLAQQEQQRQESETFEKYPNLNPRSKDFDNTLHQLTRSLLVDSMMNPQDYGNKELTFLEAAKRAEKIRQVDVTKAEKKAAQEAIQGLSGKEQAALEAQGRSDRRTQTGNLDDLKYRSRRGDTQAIMERLSKIPSV